MRITPGGQIVFADYQLFVKTDVKYINLTGSANLYEGDEIITLEDDYAWKLRTIAMNTSIGLPSTIPIGYVWSVRIMIPEGDLWKPLGLYASHGEFT